MVKFITVTQACELRFFFFCEKKLPNLFQLIDDFKKCIFIFFFFYLFYRFLYYSMNI